jgi:hypothetical protein
MYTAVRSCALGSTCPLRRKDAAATSSSSTSTAPPNEKRRQTVRSSAVEAPKANDNVTIPVGEALARAKATRDARGGRVEGRSVFDALAFGGWAPETVNGRAAQIGIVCGLWRQYNTGEGFVTQAHDHVLLFAAVVAMVGVASAAPSFLGKTYGGDPKSKKDVGIFTARKEMIHGRLAMLAIAYEVYLELSARGATSLF